MGRDARRSRPLRFAAAVLAMMAFAAGSAFAQSPKKYDTGATDTEIKIGNFALQSGANERQGALFGFELRRCL